MKHLISGIILSLFIVSFAIASKTQIKKDKPIQVAILDVNYYGSKEP